MEEKTKLDEQLKENVLKLRYFESQIIAIQQHLDNLEKILLEIATTKTTLNGIKNIKNDTQSLVPLGSGVFASGTISKKDKILVDIGAGVIVERSIDDTLKMLDEKDSTVKKNIAEFQQKLSNFENEYNKLSTETQQLLKR